MYYKPLKVYKKAYFVLVILMITVFLVSCSATPIQSPTDIPDVSAPSPETTVTPTPTPTPTLAPAPEPTVNPVPALQQKSKSVSGNITTSVFTFAIRKDGTVVQAGENKDYGTYKISK